MIDKNKTFSKLNELPQIILDIGCGSRKKNKNWIGIDLLDYESVDIVGDIYDVLKYFPDNSVDEVHSYHFFEHIPDVRGLLMELSRVLKQDGLIEIVVPHFSNPYFYSDYTHKNFFGLYSMSYLVRDNYLHRKVPHYEGYLGLEIQSINLRFKSPFYLTYAVRQFWQMIFNSFVLIKEWYEDSWSNIIPCYEIRFLLKRSI